MLKQLTLGAAIVAGAVLLAPVSTPASAAPLAPVQSGVTDGANMVQEAHWRHRRHWRRHHWRHHHHYYPYYWGYYYQPYYRPYYYYNDDWRWRRRFHRRWHNDHW